MRRRILPRVHQTQRSQKYIDLSLYYAIAGLCAGVFYREFTKLNGHTGITMLSRIHPHLIGMGAGTFLLVALFSQRTDLTAHRSFRRFLPIYNIGMVITTVFMLIRGLIEVLGVEPSTMVDASISGFAGIGHILCAVGIIMLLSALRAVSSPQETGKK